MSDEQEGGFVVRDRRRFMSDEEATPTPPPTSTPPPTVPPVPPASPTNERLSTFAGQSGATQPGEYETVDELARDQMAQGPSNPAAFSDEDDAFDPAEFMGEGEGQGEGGMQEIPDVYSMLLVFLEQLRGLAIVYMGLTDHPSLANVAPDLAQARTAINTATFVASQLDPVLANEDKVQLKAMISDLQVAFVEISKRQAAETPAPSPFAMGATQSPAGQGGQGGQGGFGGGSPAGGRGNAGGGFMGGMMGGGSNPGGGPPPRRRG